MNTHNYIEIPLSKGQFLTDIEPFKSTGIPTNSIIHKTVTGCGMTTCEIKSKRHSIIILPNVPVIKGKVKKWNKEHEPHERILAVHKNVEIPHIEDYLSSNVTYKKILTTPEGFNDKVVKAFLTEKEMLETFFLLFDECDRLVSDVSYRDKIAAPVELFFEFHSKAMVSATVLPFSDPRFEAFDHYVVVPQYDYRKRLKLIDTNNVLESVRRHLKSLEGAQVSIFVNSTDTIAALIYALGIKHESRVHCGTDSVFKLRYKKDFQNATSELDVSALKKYNFFTSRFFSAVDIEVAEQPDIVIITDVLFAPQSIIDPHTEAIQITGRYRNGIKTLAHITNIDPDIESMSEEEAKGYLHAHFEVYELLRERHSNEVEKVRKAAFKSAYESLPAHDFFQNGKRNSFMVDNFYHEERVKGYYRSPDELLKQYKAANGHFIVDHAPERYTLGDQDDLRKYRHLSKSKLNMMAALNLDKVTPKPGEYSIEPEGVRAYIREEFQAVAEGYDLFGLKGLAKTNYTDASIRRAIKQEKKGKMLEVLKARVLEVFGSEDIVSENEIKGRLQSIYDAIDHKEEALPTHIKRFYPKAQRTTRDGVKVFSLKGTVNKQKRRKK